ncbi:unnamed protein product, partial [Prorocentrum cordatum]
GLGFTTLHPDFAARGIQVLGVSPSSPEENRKFREEYGLPFPLLSDARQSIPRALGVSGRWGALLHPLREGGRKVAMFWPSVNPAEFARNALRLIDRNFPDRVPEEDRPRNAEAERVAPAAARCGGGWRIIDRQTQLDAGAGLCERGVGLARSPSQVSPEECEWSVRDLFAGEDAVIPSVVGDLLLADGGADLEFSPEDRQQAEALVESVRCSSKPWSRQKRQKLTTLPHPKVSKRSGRESTLLLAAQRQLLAVMTQGLLPELTPPPSQASRQPRAPRQPARQPLSQAQTVQSQWIQQVVAGGEGRAVLFGESLGLASGAALSQAAQLVAEARLSEVAAAVESAVVEFWLLTGIFSVTSFSTLATETAEYKALLQAPGLDGMLNIALHARRGVVASGPFAAMLIQGFAHWSCLDFSTGSRSRSGVPSRGRVLAVCANLGAGDRAGEMGRRGGLKAASNVRRRNARVRAKSRVCFDVVLKHPASKRYSPLQKAILRSAPRFARTMRAMSRKLGSVRSAHGAPAPGAAAADVFALCTRVVPRMAAGGLSLLRVLFSQVPAPRPPAGSSSQPAAPPRARAGGPLRAMAGEGDASAGATGLEVSARMLLISGAVLRYGQFFLSNLRAPRHLFKQEGASAQDPLATPPGGGGVAPAAPAAHAAPRVFPAPLGPVVPAAPAAYKGTAATAALAAQRAAAAATAREAQPEEEEKAGLRLGPAPRQERDSPLPPAPGPAPQPPASCPSPPPPRRRRPRRPSRCRCPPGPSRSCTPAPPSVPTAPSASRGALRRRRTASSGPRRRAPGPSPGSRCASGCRSRRGTQACTSARP